MAINQQRKKELVENYIDILQRAKGIVITEYSGMAVQDVDELRHNLREKNARFMITKNTLLKIAMNEVGMTVPENLLVGPIALAVAFEDLPSTVKVVLDYAKDSEVLVAKGGTIGETLIEATDLQAISELPSLDVLRAQLAGMVTMPLSQFVNLLNEPGRQVVAVLKAATDGVVNVLVLAAYSQQDAA